jgi:tetratricopeptide (TPR) repeat protein
MLLDQQRRTGHVEVITLNGLNPENLKKLVQHLLNQPPSPSFLDALYHQTNGIPFWALEVVRHLLDEYGDNQALQNIKEFPLIESAHAFILSRLSRFSEDSRYLLACAAIFGDDISITLLKSVSDMSQHGFLIALNPLIQYDFLRTDPSGDTSEGKLTFTHEILREVVIREMNAVHRQMLHQRVAVELSNASDSMAIAAVIAEHFKAAGDVENGFKWHLKAAGHAWDLGAAKDVIWSYQQAEELLKNTPGNVFGVDDIFHLYYQWGQFAYQSNQKSMLEEVGVKLQVFIKNQSDNLLTGLSNLILAMACFLWEDFETGLLLSQKAAKDLENAGQPAALIQAYFLKALFDWWSLDFNNVFTSADRITRLVEHSPLEFSQQNSFRFIARRMICDTYIAQGEAEIALRIGQEVFQEFFDVLNNFDKLRAHNMLAHAYFVAGDVKASEQYAQEGLKIAQVLDNVLVEVIALLILSKAEIVCGHLDQAFQHASRALTLAERQNKIQSIVTANTLLGDIFDILHNTTQAMQYYRIAQVRQGYTFQSYFGLENNIHLARLLTRKGLVAEARELLHTTLAVTEESRLMSFHIQALMADGLIDFDEGLFSLADQKFSMSVAIGEQKGLVQEVVWGKYRMAQMAYSQQQYDQAEELLLEILKITRLQGMVLLNKFALELTGQLSRKKSLSIPLDKLQSNYKTLVAQLEAHTQSEPLRGEFMNARRVWREKEIYS